jgi:PAS domain-containing protein
MIVSASLLSLAKQIGALSPIALQHITQSTAALSGHDCHNHSGMLARLCERTTAFGVSCDGYVVAVNRYLANLLGYDVHELIGQPISMVVAGPYDAKNRPAYPYSAVVPHRHKCGHIMPLQVSAFPVLAAPGCIYWLTVFDAPD